jgi:hypothetical protein
MAPQFLVLGHIVKDVDREGWRPGGGVLYAAAQASALGLGVAAVTRCGPEVTPARILPGVDWHVVPSLTTTSFENSYVLGRRRQRLHSLAPPLRLDDVPIAWRSAQLSLLATVFHDVDPALVTQLTTGFLGLGAQGWLRRRRAGRILPGRFSVAPPWLGGHVVFVSDEDLAGPELVSAWQSIVPSIVLTHGLRGCTLWDDRGRFDLPGFPAEEVDPTGAGDVFSAAFLVRLSETGDAREALRFAAAAAALSVRATGIGGIAGRREIEALLQRDAVGV